MKDRNQKIENEPASQKTETTNVEPSTSQNIITETTGISLVFTTYFHSKKKIHHAIFTHLVSRIPIDVCGDGRQFYATTKTTITTTTIDGIHNNNHNIWTNRHPTAHVR